MNISILFILLFIVRVDLRRHDQTDDVPSNLQREKKYSSRKKVLEDVDEPEKPSRHSSRMNNRSRSSDTRNRLSTTTPQNYVDEASLCINEFDVKTEQLVKVKELKNGAHMIRFVHIEEPSTSHGLDIRDICMLNCCVEKNCDLAMLSEQRTNEGYKCYLFACNGSCTYASHQDYTSMILKKDILVDDESSSIGNKQSSDSSSTILATTCRSNEFSCRDGSCIPYYDVCNSYEDCPSGIDEAMCSPEFILHQRTQKENRLKPSVDLESDPDEIPVDELAEEDSTTTMKSQTKTTSSKSSSSKSKSNNREGSKTNKNYNSSYIYNVDLDTQQQLSKLQRLKEHLEETKGPEAWYHLFQSLVQHQQQDHSNTEPEQSGSSVADEETDDDNFKDHLLALEQQWIADRQKTTTEPTTTLTTTIKSRVTNRKTMTKTSTTTKRMKIINNDDELRERRPPMLIDDELTDEQVDDEGGGGGGDESDSDRYYWQPAYDDRRGDRYKYPQKSRTTTTTTTTRKSKMKNPMRETSMTTLLRANGVDSDNAPHGRSFLRESSVILLLFLGLIFTIILLVLVGFYCRDSWKHGRSLKSRSTDADYLVNGLYL